MNAATRIIITEAAQIEAALDVLLSALIEADKNPAWRLIPPRGPVSVAALAHEYVDSLSWTPAQRKVGGLVGHPVSAALREAIHDIGVRLHEIGGMKLMHDAMNRAVDRDPAYASRRMAIIDARWDGIGNWMS